MKFGSISALALAALVGLGAFDARADNMASIAIAPATGEVTLVPRWSLGGNLAGFQHMAQDLSLGGGSNQFYSIKATGIPAGGDISAFTVYIAGTGAATNHADIGSKLTPNAYSALTSADPDLGYGSVQLYFIHHKDGGDYFTHIVPSSGTASAVTDLKPMSGPGGPATLGDKGYFGLTFAAANLGYGLNYFYYLRTDPVTGNTQFGTLDPALLGTGTLKFDLGTSGYKALVFTGSDIGYGTDKMYYLRLDPITGFTILGTLHPLTGKTSDIANLGSVYSALTFVPGDVGFGSGLFYITGSVNPTWQSVSFAAIADRLISAGSFTVKPTASSGLPVTLAVVTGSTGAASISGPVAGVYTVTPTGPGVITLQATQAGQLVPATEFNMLRQSFTVTGSTLLAISAQPTSQSAVTGTTANFAVTASGTSTLSYQWRHAGINLTGNASALTAALALPNVQSSAAGTYDVVVSNLSGSIVSDPVTLTVTAAAPIISNSPLTAGATVGTPFSFTITASSSPTSYSASPLPAGLSIVAATGVITGTPTTVGTTAVLLGATNATGTGNATLTITVAAAGVAPVITNSPLTSAGTVGTPFSFTITATGTPTSFAASPQPAGLSIVAATGVISGTPTTVGTTAVLLGATNATGTDSATLTITIAAAGVAPIITNNPLTAAGTVGTPLSFTITASGSPTSYTAPALPAGLSIVAATGVITGTPTTVGTTAVLLGATNATGTGNATLTITVAAAGVAPVITNSPLTAAGTVGTPFSFTITATGTPTSFAASPLPAGLVRNATTGVISGTPTTAGTTAVVLGATNATGTGNATLTITVAAAGVTPIITNNPLVAAGTVGTPFSFTITATGLPTTYAAVGLPAGLTMNATTGVISGTPTTVGTTAATLQATNTTGTSAAVLQITIAAAPISRIVNFSARAISGPGDQTLIMGFVVSGDGKNLLVRGIGPGLTPFGITNVLVDPMLTLFDAAHPVGMNDNWEINSAGQAQGPAIIASALAVGAFPLEAGSKDAALIITVDHGAHTTGLIRPNSSTGVALTEVYDTDILNGAHLTNVSVRMQVTTGQGAIVAGFVIAGNRPSTVLIRGVGPTLTQFGIADVLANPQLSVYSGATWIAGNDDWATTDNVLELTTRSAQVGAFPLPAASADAAMLLTLEPGAYSIVVSGVGATTGVGMIEVYSIP